MYRYLFVIADETRRMRAALAARGHRPRHLLQAAATGRLATALFLRAHARAERVHTAMAARGWSGVPLAPAGAALRRADVAFVAALAGTNLTSRTAYAMGREGGLPRTFAWTHPRFKTPWTGIAFSLVVTLLLGVIFAHHYDPITYFIWMATAATIGILITYILIALSGVVFFARARTHGWNPLLDLVLPAGAIAICGYTLYKSIHPTPAYTGVLRSAPWVALIWLAAGVVIDLVLTLTRPAQVSAFGSILGAGEGEAAGGEPAPVLNP
jgi:amino acid transporter